LEDLCDVGRFGGEGVEEVKIGTMAPVCFTAASEFSNFPAPARTGKTAHNSHRFLMETLLKQCSLEPQGLIFPDRTTSEIRKLYPRSMQPGTMVPIFTSSRVVSTKAGFGFFARLLYFLYDNI